MRSLLGRLGDAPSRAGQGDLLAGEPKPGAAAAKLRLAEWPRRRRWRAPIPPLPPPQGTLSLPTISAPRRRRREDKEKVQSHSPGDFHRLPPAPLLPSVHPGPPPSCLILPGFSEKSQVTFFAQQGSCSLRERRLQGPSGMSAARDGRGRAEQSRARGRGGAGRVNVTAQYLYLYRCSRCPPRLQGLDMRGAGRPGSVRKLV